MSGPSSRRAEKPLFDPKNYYIMVNAIYGPKLTLGSGADPDRDPAVMSANNTTESENWQFFHQGDRYYIRNYHNGADRQLGLIPGNTEKPQMRQRSGDLGQQWTVLQVGTEFVLINALYGSTANLSLHNGLGVGSAAGMYSGIGGDRWNITINPSAAEGRNIDDDSEWLSPVKNVQSPMLASSSTNTPPPTSTPSPTNSPTPSSSSTSIQNNSTSSQAISGGAIAGIAIGAVVLIGSLVFILWFVLVKRHKAQPPAYVQTAAYVQTGSSAATEKYAHRFELPIPPTELSADEERRMELDSRA